ncbi:EVE domain-containing protein [Marinomonas posidonica]|uniref:EVE domain-containing protein n=1 Tax=Marinomonas posidonica TaxID=936476 RepID=UPI0037365A20
MPNYWLMKSEPDAFSIDDLAAMQVSPWDGVRNYQARNFMKKMQLGDQIFFYHSSCKPAGIVGIAEVVKEAYPDYTSWDPKSAYFDAKSTPTQPRWFMVDVAFVTKFPRLISLAELKEDAALNEMPLTQKGSRLSIMPIRNEDWDRIQQHLK